MVTKASKKSLLDAYQFDGYKTGRFAKGKFGDKHALVLPLIRRSKKVSAHNAESFIAADTIARPRLFATCPVAPGEFTWSSRFGVFAAEILVR
jgi:hypothetical protein